MSQWETHICFSQLVDVRRRSSWARAGTPPRTGWEWSSFPSSETPESLGSFFGLLATFLPLAGVFPCGFLGAGFSPPSPPRARAGMRQDRTAQPLGPNPWLVPGLESPDLAWFPKKMRIGWNEWLVQIFIKSHSLTCTDTSLIFLIIQSWIRKTMYCMLGFEIKMQKWWNTEVLE